MKNKKHAKAKPTFKAAVEATPDVKGCYNPGLKALESKDRKKIVMADTQKCGGSLFIDDCLTKQKKNINENRWDYAIDYAGKVYFVEVHTASSSEVSVVSNKLSWLKGWLINNAPQIEALRAKDKAYYWIQSGRYDIPPHLPQAKRALQLGIKPISKLELK
jgi:hypothetical protein